MEEGVALGDDHGMINPNAFKRRLLRAAVQENVKVMTGNWPRLDLSSQASRPAWLNMGAALAVVFTLSLLVYVAATANAPREVVQASPSQTKAEAPLDSAAQASPLLAPIPSLSPLSAEVEEVSTGDVNRIQVEEVNPEVLSSVEPAASDAELCLPNPRPIDFRTLALAAKKIVIDPGHGGDDPGTKTSQGLTEKEITLDIGLRLRALLTAASFEVRMTREKDEARSLMHRAAFANEEDGDLFVSIHVNWIAPRGARVVETYYLGPTEDTATLQITGAENHQSGYSLADFRRLLEEVYTDVKRGESRKLAEAIQGELARALSHTNPSSTPRAVKTAPFVVLVGAHMPAILTEVACLSNKEEARLLATPEYRQQIAQALFAGIRSYVDDLSLKDTTR
jgi:N-acetylmuramoyl-L-alanine amidase